mmetsp:Transcript_12795/g.12706  ORF Transcript_12795/g.12706 Transcript_12795/m.12706 type:complete len:89 (+) Transcript_12795:75-341(+)
MDHTAHESSSYLNFIEEPSGFGFKFLFFDSIGSALKDDACHHRSYSDDQVVTHVMEDFSLDVLNKLLLMFSRLRIIHVIVLLLTGIIF